MNQNICSIEEDSIDYLEMDSFAESSDKSISSGGNWVIAGGGAYFTAQTQLFGQVSGRKDGSVDSESLPEAKSKTASIEEVLNQERNQRIFYILRLLNEASGEFFEEELVNLKEKDKLAKIGRFDKSKEEARNFMEALSFDISLPSVIPEEDGEIGLEWRHHNRGLLISFEGEQVISYAGYYGEKDRFYGTKEFNEQNNPPQILINYIDELYSTDY